MNIQLTDTTTLLNYTTSLIYRLLVKQKSILYSLTTMLISVNCIAQNSILKVSYNTAIVSPENSIPYTEPYIVVNPTDEKNMVIGSIKVKDTGWETVAHVSLDGGESWVEKRLPIPDSVVFTGDPYLAFNSKGVLYYTMLGSLQKGIGQLLFKSSDKGKSWSVGVWVSTNFKLFFDHSTIAIDNSKESPFYNNVYAASHVNYRGSNRELLLAPFVSVSSDGGESFHQEGIFGPSLKNMNNGNAVVTSTGDIYFFYFVLMDDNGKWLEKHQLKVIHSEDGGKAFSNPVLISDEFTAYYPDAAINKSKRFKDRIYVTWTYTNEPDKGIYLSYKDADSKKWSDPVKVNDSLSVTPLISSIAINDKGIVGVSWFDNRNDPSTTCYDIYFSYSEDGGISFGKDYRITDQSSCPTMRKSGEALSRWKRGGDFHGLTTAGSDFHIVWPDARNGLFLPYYAKISLRRE
ncbi:MAG: exo-alpha-sialidase [Balneola sp.]